MRSFVRAALAALAALTITAGVAIAQATPPSGLKIAYINSQKILAQAPGRAEAEAQIQKEMDGYRAEVQQMGDSLNILIAAYNKAEPTLSADAKESRQKEIQTRQNEYQQRVQQLEQQAQQRQAEVFRPLMQQINKIIEQIRAEDGYAMIFDAGNQAGVVVAADSSLDITDKVIARLKAAGPVSSTTPKPSSAPTRKRPAGPTIKPVGPTRPDTSPSQA